MSFAFGWTDVTMLGWLAAAAAPVVIHLWSRRRHAETPWAAMMFLTAAVRQRRRRILFEQWLILAVRTLLIVLVVVAVAGPYWNRTGRTLAAGGRTHRVLVFDASYSMGYRAAGKTRLDEAKAIARRIVENAPASDVFSLVVMSSSPRIADGVLAADAALREIDAIAVRPTTADLPATAAAIEKLAERVDRENAGPFQRREVCFFSDMQRVTWTPDAKKSGARDVGSLFAARNSGRHPETDVFMFDVGCPAAENTAVVELATKPADRAATIDRPVTLSVRLQAFGGRGCAKQPVELRIDGCRVARKQVDVPAGGAASVEFSHRFDAPGDHAIEVSAPGDALEIDNRRFLVLPVRREMRVLCIDGCPSGVAFRGAADYLAAALAPGRSSDGGAPIRAEIADENALIERNLDDYDCVFLCNVARFTTGEAGRLDAYLRAGGSVVFFLGDQASAENYNKELGVLPARLGEIVDRSPSALDPLGYRHPILRAFRGRGQSSLTTTVIYKYFRLAVAKDSDARIVLATIDGDPLIVERPFHRGRVVLVATSADPSWTAMPLWTSFVPLVQEIVAWCAAGQTAQRNFQIGALPDTLGLLAERGATATQCGIHNVARKSAATARGPSAFAVNVDAAESDLSRADAKELRDFAGPGSSMTFAAMGHGSEMFGGTTPDSGRLQLDLLYAALGLLLFETFLAYTKTRR